MPSPSEQVVKQNVATPPTAELVTIPPREEIIAQDGSDHNTAGITSTPSPTQAAADLSAKQFVAQGQQDRGSLSPATTLLPERVIAQDISGDGPAKLGPDPSPEQVVEQIATSRHALDEAHENIPSMRGNALAQQAATVTDGRKDQAQVMVSIGQQWAPLFTRIKAFTGLVDTIAAVCIYPPFTWCSPTQ